MFSVQELTCHRSKPDEHGHSSCKNMGTLDEPSEQNYCFLENASYNLMFMSAGRSLR
jgi:hypothetical protein